MDNRNSSISVAVHAKYVQRQRQLQERKLEQCFSKYNHLKVKMNEYVQASQIEENLYEFSLRFKLDSIQHQFTLALNLNQRLPVRDNVHFRFASTSRLFWHIKCMVRLQHSCISTRAKFNDNIETLNELSALLKQFESAHPEKPVIFESSLFKFCPQSSIIQSLEQTQNSSELIEIKFLQEINECS